jgi:hypothetical protein
MYRLFSDLVKQKINELFHVEKLEEQLYITIPELNIDLNVLFGAILEYEEMDNKHIDWEDVSICNVQGEAHIISSFNIIDENIDIDEDIGYCQYMIPVKLSEATNRKDILKDLARFDSK